MKKIIVSILVMVFVLSLAWIAGAQTSSSGQPGSGTTGSKQGTDQSGTSQQYGGSTPESRQGTERSGTSYGGSIPESKQPGMDQSGTSQQYKGRESQMKHQGKSMQNNRASHWIGMKVQNQQGENLGQIEDMILNSKGQVDFVIVSHGGTLGIGEKYTAVPFKAFSRKGETLTLNISKEKMAEAPNFEKNSWPDMTNRKWSEDVYRYYGQKPSWRESSHPSQKPSKDSSRTEQNKKKME